MASYARYPKIVETPSGALGEIEMLRVHAGLARQLIEDLGARVNVEALTLYAAACEARADQLEADKPVDSDRAPRG